MNKKLFVVILTALFGIGSAMHAMENTLRASAAVSYQELIPGSEWYYTFTSPFGIAGSILAALSIYSGFKLVHKVVNDYSFAKDAKDEKRLDSYTPLWVGLGLVSLGGGLIYATQSHVSFIKQGGYLAIPR